ncbi:MAG: transposase [Lachnospiraceae bacterium]|nr:transposase [Lachnospiraceae bacterium]
MIILYIFYSGPGGKYASAATSKRDGKNTSVDATYLGTVIDRERGIYKSRERGFFTFDPATGEYGEVPDDFSMPAPEISAKHSHVSVDFGDAFILNAFLYQSGFMDVIDTIDYSNKETLHAMVLFYTLSAMANADAIHWYQGSIARVLYPKANMASQRISELLAQIGTPDSQLTYQQKYIQFVQQHYNPDKNILIDSSGLPNSIHFPLTHRNVHNGKVSNEVRLIFVVQRSTGLPLFYRAVPGNIVDMSTLERILLHLDSLGVDIDSCIMDAGYNTADNLDLFYTDDHECKINFITRVKANDKHLRAMIKESLPNIDRRDNFVKYQDRYLFIVKKQVMVGIGENNPAWMYLGLDYSRLSDEQHKLLKRAAREEMTADAVYEAMQTEGLFGVISGHEYPCEEILPAYYQRQSAEQIFDFAKNYTKLLPLRTATEATFQGHLLLSYIASCAVKMLQMKLKTADLFFGSRLQYMRNQKCTIYHNRLITDVPQKEANETYQALGIKCPASIAIVNGELQYTPPAKEEDEPPKKRKRRSGAKSVTATDSNKKQPEHKTKQKSLADAAPKKRGRPKGSKNKKTLEREALQQAQQKRGRGRPKGSKNKKTLEREAQLAATQAQPTSNE